MHKGCLDRDDLSVLYFRVSFDLGIAVERSRRELVSALAPKEQSLFAYLSDRSLNWIDRHIESLSDLDYNGHLKLVREHIRAEKVVGGTLGTVLDGIARATRGRSVADLARMLDELSRHAHELVGLAVKKFGDSRAHQRWSRCPRVPLVFVQEADGLTRCSFEPARKGQAIYIHIGSHLDSATDPRKGALRLYFNMLFFFFHEYLSHAFSHWQEYLFVEGYLVWAATELLLQLEADLLRHQYVRQTLKAAGLARLEEARDTAEWFDRISGGRFLKYLLAWAADDGFSGEPQDLTGLQLLAQMASGERGRRKQAILDGIEAALSETDPHLTRESLRLLARKSAAVPQFTSRI